VLHDSVFVHIRLQQLKPRLVLFSANRLQPHKHADPVDDGCLAEPHQPIHSRSNSCLYWLGLLLLSGIGLSDGLLHARQQIRPLYAYQIRQLLRPLQPQVHLISLAVLDSVLRSFLNALLHPGHLLAHLCPCGLAINWHHIGAVVAGSVDLEILQPVAAAEQSLAIHTRVSLVHSRL
jgi:hypothetical protein